MENKKRGLFFFEDENDASMKEFATNMKKMFDSLTESGFTEPQALDIIKTIMAMAGTMGGNKR